MEYEVLRRFVSKL